MTRRPGARWGRRRATTGALVSAPRAGSGPGAGSERTRHRLLLRLVALGVLLGVAVAIAAVTDLPDHAVLQRRVDDAGWWGPVLFVLGYAVLTLAPVPKAVFSIVGGALFGFVAALALVLTGALIGSLAAFWIGRALGREAVEGLSGKRVERLDELLRDRGLAAVIGLRLVPVVPFTAMNYAAGLTAVSLRHYALGTALGITPGTAGYVAVGAFGTGALTPRAVEIAGIVVAAGIVAVILRGRRAGQS